MRQDKVVTMNAKHKLAYIRVSSVDQNTERQLADMEFDETFTDKCSGSTVQRDALIRLKVHCRKCDAVYVHSIDRLARNLADLQILVQFFVDKGVEIHFVKESLSFTGEDNPFQNLQLQIIGSCAEFERAMIRARQREGIAARKAKGLPVGRKSVVSDDMRDGILKAAKGGTTKAAIAKEFGIGRATVYRVLDKMQHDLDNPNGS
jgi:DNA invertase Pin-like site-specific DNA recombinase